MFKKILLAAICAVVSLGADAQDICTINGSVAGGGVKNVVLTRTDSFGNEVNVATAKVKRGKYSFQVKLAKDEPVMLYNITGLGEGSVELFVEPGVVTVSTSGVSAAEQSRVTGTPTNDTYAAYKAIYTNGEERIKANTPANATAAEIKRIEAKENILTRAQAIRFLIENNASPVMPLEVERTLLSQLSEAYADQMTKAVSSSLHSHPYYLSLRNKVLANNLKVGNEVPDIALPLLDGTMKNLKDYRGRYVVLNFWANGCSKSDSMLAELQSLYDILKSDSEFVIVSFALENSIDIWKESVAGKNINREGWVNACDGAGAASTAAKYFGVEKAPKIILIEPEGRAVTLDMDIDELIMRVEQILSGDLYYLDDVKE